MFPPWLGAALINSLPPAVTQFSIVVWLAERKELSALAFPSLPSSITKGVVAANIVFAGVE
jgi:hypothetical protein